MSKLAQEESDGDAGKEFTVSVLQLPVPRVYADENVENGETLLLTFS